MFTVQPLKIDRVWRGLYAVVLTVLSVLLFLPAHSHAETDPFANPNPFATRLSTGAAAKFLPVDQAFSLSSRLETGSQAGQVLLSFRVTPAHYLYRDRFKLVTHDGLSVVGEPVFSQPPHEVEDPEFGRVPVDDQDVTVRVALRGQGRLEVRWQGCAKAGLCYPPQSTFFPLSIAAPEVPVRMPRTRLEQSAGVQSVRIPLPTPLLSIESNLKQAAQQDDQPINRAVSRAPNDAAFADTPTPSASALPDLANPNGNLLPPNPSTSNSVNPPLSVVDTDPFGLATHPLSALFLLFLAGLGLSFTPCVLPMLPIVANLVARQHRRSAWHGLWLSSAYAFGVASSYALLGALVALFGQQLNIVGALQQPAVLVGFALFFVLLALVSFELVPLAMPQALAQRIDRLSQWGQGERLAGSLLGSAVVGFFSALVVSPCVSAPLAGVLLSVSTVGNPWLGAAALFMLGVGLSVPLIILGATEGRFLPKAGAWLNWVRQGFGLLLLAVALLLLERVWSNSAVLALWALLLALCASWLWHWQGRGQWVSRALALVCALWVALQLFGVAQGGNDPWQPLQSTAMPTEAKDRAALAALPVPRLTQLAQLNQVKTQTPLLLVDVTADWCISCKIMERELFDQRLGAQPVEGLSAWTRVKLDVTDNNADSQAVLQQLQLFGPPVLLFYRDGVLQQRLVGEVSAAELRSTLQQLARDRNPPNPL